MQVLIVEQSYELAQIWIRHLERQGLDVALALDISEAMVMIQSVDPALLILDVATTDGSALALADYVHVRFPQTKIIFTSNVSFFSDGSIFNHSPNACALLPKQVDPTDLAHVACHYCGSERDVLAS